MSAAISRFTAKAEPDDVFEAIDRDGVVIVEGLLTDDVVQRVNDDVEAAVAAADPHESFFNPVMTAFHGLETKQVAGMPGLSRTFATDVMCHPMLLATCAIASCCRRARATSSTSATCSSAGPAPKSSGCTATKLVWSDVPVAASRAAARVGDRVRRLHRATTARPASCPAATAGPTARSPALEQMQEPSRRPSRSRTRRCRPARRSSTSAAPSTPAARTRTDVPRRGAHLSYCLGWLRTEENNYLSIPPAYVDRRCRARAQEVLGYAVHDSIDRGGGYLGMVRMQDPVELIARGELG